MLANDLDNSFSSLQSGKSSRNSSCSTYLAYIIWVVGNRLLGPNLKTPVRWWAMTQIGPFFFSIVTQIRLDQVARTSNTNQLSLLVISCRSAFITTHAWYLLPLEWSIGYTSWSKYSSPEALKYWIYKLNQRN